MENNIEYLDSLNRINFDQVYRIVVNNTYNNFSLIFTPYVKARIENLFDLSKFTNPNLEDYITPDKDGKFKIDNRKYSFDRDLFLLIDIVVYENIRAELNKALLYFNIDKSQLGHFKTDFHYNLKKALEKNIRHKYTSGNNTLLKDLKYNSKKEYIISCINSAILTCCILCFRDTTVYKDVQEIVSSRPKIEQ